MKNLVFLRTVMGLTPITRTVRAPRKDRARGSCLTHRNNFPSTQISTFSSLEIILGDDCAGGRTPQRAVLRSASR